MITIKEQFSYKLAKRGNKDEEYEDSYNFTTSHDHQNFKSAIADGATETSFAKEWANLLTNGFVQQDNSTEEEFANNLSSLREEWEFVVRSSNLTWFTQAKASEGAFAAFLGIIVNLENKTLKYFAVGDCCLFIIRDSNLIVCEPIKSSTEFGKRPYLISSLKAKNHDIISNIKTDIIQVQNNDTIILMSDAIAQWYLTQYENENNECPILEESPKWIDTLRGSNAITNDDVTLIMLKVEEEDIDGVTKR